jgi:hypothetical protein
MKLFHIATVILSSAMLLATVGCSKASTVPGIVVDEKVICSHCGQVLNGPKCCNPDTGARCSKCGLAKESPGCCKPDVVKPEPPKPE